MSDSLRLQRQWLLLNQLAARRRGMTVREMADEHGVNLKTIRRDIDALRRAGFRLEETVIEQGCKVWKLNGAHGAPLSFNLTEAMALYLGRRFLEPLAGTHFWEGATSAFRKIKATLGEQALAYLDKLAATFYQTTFGSDYSHKGETIDVLMRAIEDRNLTELHYHSQKATEPVEYEIHPYGLAYHAGALYVVAWSADHRQIRHFKVDRIEEVRVTQIQFPRPANFDIAAHFAGSLGIFGSSNGAPVAVRVRFSPEVSQYVREHRRHKSQKVHAQKDGSLVAEFQLADLHEIKSWLLSFGAHAEALEPPELVAAMRREIETMNRVYSPDDARIPPLRKAGQGGSARAFSPDRAHSKRVRPRRVKPK
jgi:proteasome accessory factor B